MNAFMIVVGVIGISLVSSVSFADTYVKGYFRKNGTYVQPHIKASRNTDKWDNYGPSKNNVQHMSPRTRENDQDGTPNFLDPDDNNNSNHDNYERNQYKMKGF
ncbi:MAG: hypothetical protein HGA52_01755 [Bacteroidales bacterium]|nr:hypothetical protein [Bacteroidales bacterium]